MNEYNRINWWLNGKVSNMIKETKWASDAVCLEPSRERLLANVEAL